MDDMVTLTTSALQEWANAKNRQKAPIYFYDKDNNSYKPILVGEMKNLKGHEVIIISNVEIPE